MIDPLPPTNHEALPPNGPCKSSHEAEEKGVILGNANEWPNYLLIIPPLGLQSIVYHIIKAMGGGGEANQGGEGEKGTNETQGKAREREI